MKKLDVGIDLLVVNPQLSGVGGLVQSLTRAHPKLKIIVIGELSRALAAEIRPQANLARPAASEAVSRPEWVKKVKKLLKEVSVAAAV